MICTDKGSMVQAQYCSEWTELWYSMLHGSIPLFQDTEPELRVYCPLQHVQVFIIDWLLIFVNQTQVGHQISTSTTKNK